MPASTAPASACCWETRQIKKNDLVLCGREQNYSPSNISPANWRSNSTRRARCRSACARRRRHPGLLHRTGAGTDIAKGKEERDFDGEKYIMERGIVADLAIVHAWKAIPKAISCTARPRAISNPMMATAGKVTIAEVEHLVQPGELSADTIITPGVYVAAYHNVPNAVKHIEQRTGAQARLKEICSALDPRADGRTRRQGAARRISTSISASASRPLVSNYIPDGHERAAAKRKRHARLRTVSL